MTAITIETTQPPQTKGGGAVPSSHGRRLRYPREQLPKWLRSQNLADLFFENERVTDRIRPQTINENERLYRSVLAPRTAALLVAEVTPLVITRNHQGHCTRDRTRGPVRMLAGRSQQHDPAGAEPQTLHRQLAVEYGHDHVIVPKCLRAIDEKLVPVADAGPRRALLGHHRIRPDFQPPRDVHGERLS